MKILSNLLSLPLVRNTLKLSSSNFILVFLPLIVTPILSRVYTPEEFGDWGIFSSVFYIVTAFLFFSYENTIVKTTNEDEIDSLVWLNFIVSQVVIILVYVVFLVGYYANIKFFTTFPCPKLLLLLLFIYVFHIICTSLANRNKQYSSIAIANLIGGICQPLFRILIGVFSLLPYGLIIGNVLSQVVTTVYLALLKKQKLLHGIRNFDKETIKYLVVKYKKFPLYDAPARMVEFSLSNIALIILTLFWSKDLLGSYSMVLQFLILPISLIGSAIGNVYYREISEHSINHAEVSNITIQAARMTFSLSLLPLLFLILGGDFLLVLFLGEKWQAASPIALCLSIMSVPLILSEPLLPIFRSLDKQKTRLFLNIINLIATIGSLLISAYLFHNIYLSLFIYAFFSAVIRYIMFLVVLRLANVKIHDISVWFWPTNIICFIALIIRLWVHFQA